MNTFKTLALGVVLAGFGIADAAAAVPAGPVFATFVSDKGLRAKESERYAQVYVKSSNVGDTVFFQFGEGAKIDTLVLTKANTMVNIKKTGLEGAGTVVKIWAPQTVWFLNIRDNDATSFTPGTCATSVREFSCENDSLNNMDFLPQMQALEYLVSSNNRRVKSITVNNPNLQRLQLGKMPNLASLTVNAPVLYEFKLDDMPLIPSLDVSGCPALKTFTLTKAPNLASLKLSTGQVLESFTLSGSEKLAALELKDMPKLKRVQVYENPGLANVSLGNLPALATMLLRQNHLTDYSISNLPALRTLVLSNNPFTKLDINLPDLTSVTIDQCNLDTIDLRKLTVLKSCYVRKGNVKCVLFADNALQNTATTFVLTENRMGISQLPPRPAKMNASLNYYAPQAQPQLPTTIKAEELLDLSDWTTGHTLDGTVPSVITWETKFEEALVEGTDYSVQNGKYKFLHEIEDSVRCYITNKAFPAFARTVDSKGNVTDYRIISNFIKVDKKQGVTSLDSQSEVSVKAAGNLTIEIEGLPAEAPVFVYAADGSEVAEAKGSTDTTIKLPAAGLYIVRAAGRSFKIYVK